MKKILIALMICMAGTGLFAKEAAKPAKPAAPKESVKNVENNEKKMNPKVDDKKNLKPEHRKFDEHAPKISRESPKEFKKDFKNHPGKKDGKKMMKDERRHEPPRNHHHRKHHRHHSTELRH